MINPLNELSAVYQQGIAEGGCGDKKEKKGYIKKPEMLPQGTSDMGGDTATPGKNTKAYVQPMGEGYDKPDEKLKTDRKMFSIGQKERDAAKERLLAKAKAKREAMKEGHCEEEGVKCSPEEKKKDSKKMMKKEHYSWRENWEFLDEISVSGGYAGIYAGVDGERNLENPKAKTDEKAGKRIEERDIKNKIKINPPQGMTEAFAEIGGEIVEMYELDEKIDLKKADMGEVIKDFRKSDAPQFKGKTKEKKRQMAIAAKLEADEEGSMSEETEEEKKKREMMARTKEHDDKRSGKLAESDFPKDAPSIKDKDAPHKKMKKTNVKNYKGLGYAPTIKEKALAGVISTIRSKNGMGQISSKNKDKIQDKKEKSMNEENLDEVAPLAAIPAVLAKAGAIAAKAAAAGAKGAAAAGKVGAKVGSAAGKAAKATSKATSKVGKAVKKITPQSSSSKDDSGLDLSGVKDTAGKVAKKVVGTTVDMVKNPLRQSFATLTTNEELSIDQQMKISRDYNRMSPEDRKAANQKVMGKVKKMARQKDTRTDAQKMTDAVGKPRYGSSD